METVSDWVETLLAKTSAHEGTFGSVQRNKDGQGVSYGIIQWTQRGGGLGVILDAMYRAAPEEFARVFGVAWASLLETTRRASMEPVGGSLLWQGDWPARFAEAGKLEVFRKVQVRVASTGDHMQAAIANAKRLDVATERGMVLCYNRSVHQGVSGSSGPARALVEWWAGDPSRRPVDVNDRLAQYAWSCASKFRRTVAPTGRTLSNGHVAANEAGTLWWLPVTEEWSELRQGDYSIRRVAVEGVWHRAGGLGSLYDLIVKRSSNILLDTTIRDNPVDLAPVAVA